MKRFFCPTCNKVRRTRFIPTTVKNPKAENPTDRIGLCAHHFLGLSIAQNIRAEQPSKTNQIQKAPIVKAVAMKSERKGKR